jgi:hypothetical protein
VVYPGGVYNNPSTWPRARRLDALAVGLVAGLNPPPKGAETATAHLLDLLGQYRDAALAYHTRWRGIGLRAVRRSFVKEPRDPCCSSAV